MNAEPQTPSLGCSLYLYGDDLDPSTVTQQLGCFPDSAGLKGDRVHAKATVTFPSGVWGIISKRHIYSEDLQEHLAWVCDTVTSSAFARVSGVQKVIITILVTVGDYDEEFHIPVEFIAYAAALTATICFDVSYRGAD